MKVFIVEPHCDDCWLNLGAFILQNYKTSQIEIATVFADELGPNFTMMLGNLFGIKVHSLDYTNIEKETFVEPGRLDDAFLKKNGVPYSEMLKKIKDLAGDSELYLPQGMRDGNHNLVSRLEGDYWYREIPYYWNRREWKNVTDYVYREFNDKKVMTYPKEVISYKWQIMDTIYKRKLGFFRWWLPHYKTVEDEVIFFNKK